MLKTIYFDLGNVILFFSHDKMFTQIASLSGLSVQELKQLFLDKNLLKLYETGQIRTDTLYKIIQTSSLKQFSLTDFLDAACDIFTLNEELFPLIESLKRKDKRLILLSNVSECHYKKATSICPLIQEFDDHILSYKVGAMKPDSPIFEAALKVAQADLRDCFYTDDIPQYIQQAKHLGLDGEIFINVKTLKTAFETRGLFLDDN